MRFLNPTGITFQRPKNNPVDQVLSFLKLRSNDPNLNANLIRTTKYTIANFIPKNLFEQFHRIANIYFLLLVILPFTSTQFGVTGSGLYIGVLPLLSILLATAIKDGFEDYKRYKQDTFVNHQRCRVIQNIEDLGHLSKKDIKKLNNVQWKDISVGKIILISQDNSIPADCLILGSSDPGGIAYVETKNLDGETNLKIYEAVGMSHLYTLSRKPTKFKENEGAHELTQKWLEKEQLSIDYEDPNPNLYAFSGTISAGMDPTSPIGGTSVAPHKMPLTFKHVLLRGSILRNTEYVIGLVLYCGSETKIMLNTRPTPSKRSKIDKQLNPLVGFNFLMIAVLCIITSIGYSTVDQYPLLGIYPKDRSKPEIVSFVYENVLYSLGIAFGASLILYQNIVPISVYISIEFVKIISAYFILKDVDLTRRGQKARAAHDGIPEQPAIADQPAVPKSWTIGDDLGQIQFIFSDKTGTLTQNVMEFRRCSINGVAYGLTEDVVKEKFPAKVENASVESLHQNTLVRQKVHKTMDLLGHEMMERLETLYSIKKNHSTETSLTIDSHPGRPRLGSSVTQATNVTTKLPQFVDLSIIDHLKDTELPEEVIEKGHPDKIRQFFCFLGLCHTVIVDKTNLPIQYKAQSPDEAALVTTARDMGFSFLGVQNDEAILDVYGEEQRVPILNIIEFSSARKRMTAIIEIDKKIYMITKGADSIIYERLAPGQEEMKSTTLNHLEIFANEGLRTLCMSYRELSPKQYNEFAQEMNEAATSFDMRDEKMEQVADKYERNLMLLGATAIEDKLQRGVPDCIATLARAGIKLWVLTGDKVETAINIGYSCNLITKNMNLIVIQATNIEEMRKCLLNLISSVRSTFSNSSVEDTDDVQMANIALVIDGHSLKLVFEDEDIKSKFADHGMMCKSVICCRVSPRQKADVVALIKNRRKILALAIGDGANDVSMIQEANIGVGIAGVEGMQAAMSSDFAISQFRFLKKLLLVHGRWTYMRVSGLIVNFFYKNCVWVFCLFYFQFFCGFSTIFLFDYFYLLIYNVFLTLCPVLLLGVFDLDVNKEYSYMYPQLYQDHYYFSWKRFLIYILDAAWASSVTFFGIYFITYAGDTTYYGAGDSTDYFGALVSIPIIVTANMSVGLDIRMWNTWVTIGLVASAFSLFIIIPIYTSLPYTVSGTAYGLGLLLYQQPSFYFMSLLTVFLAIMPRLVICSWNSIFNPKNADIVREIQLVQAEKDRFDSHKEEEIVVAPAPPAHLLTDLPIVSPVIPSPESVVSEISQASSTLSRQMSIKGHRNTRILNASSMKVESNTGFAFSQESGVLKYLSFTKASSLFKDPQKKILKMFENSPTVAEPMEDIPEEKEKGRSIPRLEVTSSSPGQHKEYLSPSSPDLKKKKDHGKDAFTK
eukprot:NODE_11_length_54881_cov_1.430718.p1 type:complete len:1398 gc:universal NODE_11_length_54881_cov_1.430718:23603-19410(-)